VQSGSTIVRKTPISGRFGLQRWPGRYRHRMARGRWRAAPLAAAASEIVRFLRTEQIGGLLLLAATALALIMANSPAADAYRGISETVIGPASLHLDLTLTEGAEDGLLTIFFVVMGLELKRELVVGELRDPRQAMLPIFGAIGGMVVPAAVRRHRVRRSG
jgi:NhaA family Na+:H+ antiporter